MIDRTPEPGQPHLVLIGPPAAGKTRLGKRIARILGAPFVDTDRRIVAGHGPIAQIFSEHGEKYYRALERAEVTRALGERAVVALGGGAIIDPVTQGDLLVHRVALITVSPDAGGETWTTSSVFPLTDPVPFHTRAAVQGLIVIVQEPFEAILKATECSPAFPSNRTVPA